MSLTREFSWLPVTTMAHGGDVRLPLHVLNGAASRPHAGAHGHGSRQ